jgi:hypothetical protein
MVLSFVLYGCETWSLTIREGVELSTFKNRVLTKMLEIKR